MSKKYHRWIDEQIKLLQQVNLQVSNNLPLDLKTQIPFKITKKLEENPKEPEYVAQFLFQQPINKDGLWMEAGVYRGEMINRCAKANPDQIIYGFDSFEGFPDDGRKDWNCPEFNLNGQIPTHTLYGQPFASNIRLVKGWFADTLPTFLASQNKKISFINIDCDLYSSTSDVLEAIRTYLTDETVVCFDDAWHYFGFLNHQLLALFHFIKRYDYTVKWICYRGEMLSFDRLSERVGDAWNWKKQYKWRRAGNYSDCACYLIKN